MQRDGAERKKKRTVIDKKWLNPLGHITHILNNICNSQQPESTWL